MIPRIILPAPHSPTQSVMMRSFTAQGLIEAWFACGTKAGKSFGCAGGLSQRTLTLPGALCRWTAPIYAQTKIGFKYCRKFFPPPPHTHVDKQDLSLNLPSIDSRLEFKSGKYPEDLEGEGTHGNALDECAKMQRQVYDSVKTTTTVTRGPIVGFSTPRGKNWFYTKCMEAKEIMEWCLKRGLPPTHIFATVPSTDNPMVSAAAVEEARRSMPERLWRQYYLAEFLDDGELFIGFRDCLFGDELAFASDDTQRWKAPWYVDTPVVIGADWAKTTDYAVFTALDLTTRQLVGFWRFHKTPYTESIRRLVLFARGFKEVVVVNHDKTGVGQAIDDQLAYTELPYHGVTFTNAWKAEAVAQLMTSVEQRMIGFPRWPQLIDEMDSYEIKTTLAGNFTYGAPQGKHDDVVSSLLLSHSALLAYSDSGMTVTFVEDEQKSPAEAVGGTTPGKDHATPVEQFYRELLSDDED